ncbi:MAG: pyrimidine 5'-nucleotidase [Candidatus Micropelagos thuwalensis]|nr:pyrimidine 5'-nucleotidase [Candidatus Micropelagos thuwalensis]
MSNKSSPMPVIGPQTVYLFDLDNTLYPPEKNLFAHVDVRMTAFIEEKLGLTHDEAFFIQKKYWKEYGTTLSGLMQFHGLEPDEFLDFVHDIDVSPLTPDPELSTALANLPGKKYIFTNGTQKHAERVSDRLGVLHHFDDIFDIRAADYVPKPDKNVYHKLIANYDINPDKTIFFEDMARNLLPAHELGMTTVWLKPKLSEDAPQHAKIGHEGADGGHINYEIDNLVDFLSLMNGK